MHSAKAIWYVIDWMGYPILVMATGIFFRRKLYREFPLFFSYLVASVAGNAIRFVSKFGGEWAYFYAFEISDGIFYALNVLAVCELFAQRLFPRFHRVVVYRYLVAGGAVLSVLFGILTALEVKRKYRVFLVVDASLDATDVAMLIFLAVLMMIMGRDWTQYSFVIALGFVLSNAGDLITLAFWNRNGYHNDFFSHLGALSFDIACLIWLFGFWKSDNQIQRPTSVSLDAGMVDEARRWEGVLKDWLALKKGAPQDK